MWTMIPWWRWERRGLAWQGQSSGLRPPEQGTFLSEVGLFRHPSCSVLRKISLCNLCFASCLYPSWDSSTGGRRGGILAEILLLGAGREILAEILLLWGILAEILLLGWGSVLAEILLLGGAPPFIIYSPNHWYERRYASFRLGLKAVLFITWLKLSQPLGALAAGFHICHFLFLSLVSATVGYPKLILCISCPHLNQPFPHRNPAFNIEQTGKAEFSV